MRQAFARPMALVVCVLAISLASCSSKNKGKIEGKWKNTGGLEGVPAGMVIAEFAADGTFKMTALGMELISAKYKLGMGDSVTFSDVQAKGSGQKPGRAQIKIDGDNMTWKEDKASYTFTRLKDEKPAAPAGATSPAPPAPPEEPKKK
jgi:hypothetical protein